MRVLIVPDSFKGSTTSLETARFIRSGVESVLPGCEFRILPVADGGEGTMEALVAAEGGSRQICTVQGPLGRPVEAAFGLLPDGWAVIEMAQASGLPLLSPQERDPSIASTYGTGELIASALDLGCRRILLGIGGSATNDGGAGMAAALGVRFLDEAGRELPPGGAALERLAAIDCSGLDPRLRETEVLVASDVTNPLCGPQGASLVYGPQKGADEAMAARLDTALARYGTMLKQTFGRDFASLPGAGAAGGLGAGLMAFCHAELRPGIDIIFDRLGLEAEIAGADLIFTGEGRVDATSANGKLLSGVGRLALKYNKPVIALAGGIGPGGDGLLSKGISAVVPIADGPLTLEESLSQAPRLIAAAAARAARLIGVGRSLTSSMKETAIHSK